MNAIDNELSPLPIPGLEDELTAVLCAAIRWGGSVISSEEYIAAKQRFRAAVNAAIEAVLQSQEREDALEAENVRLREALEMMVEMVEMNGFGRDYAMDVARAALAQGES